MKFYQLLYSDGYHPAYPINTLVFSSREALRKHYGAIQSIYDQERDTGGYFIEELEVKK